MTKILAMTSAAVMAVMPAIAAAESPLYLNSTKSSGNLNAGVQEDVVAVAPVVESGVNPWLLGLLGVAAVAGVVALVDDSSDDTTTAEEDSDDDDSDN